MSCRHPGSLGAYLVALFFSAAATAEVVDSAANGFTLKTTIEIAAPPTKVYETMVGQIGAWWDPDHTFSGDADNLYLEARVNGCFCETLGGEGGVRHLTVVYVEPGKLVRLTGGLGPLQQAGVAGAMSWSFATAAAGTTLEFTYSVGGYVSGGLAGWAVPVDSVWQDLLGRLKRTVESGSPDPQAPS